MRTQTVITAMRRGADTTVDSTTTEDSDGRTFYIAASDASNPPSVAVRLVDGEAVKPIDLFGGFEPGNAAGVIGSIDCRAPVGILSYDHAEVVRH